MSPWLTMEECQALNIDAHPTAQVSRGIVSFGAHLTIGENSRIDHGNILMGEIKIGRYTHLSLNIILQGKFGITIGDFVGISSGVTIYTESDDFSGKGLIGPNIPDEWRAPPVRGPVVVERGCVVGCKSTLMPRCVLGEATAIGAHSMVPKGQIVEGWAIYAGVPIRRIRDRKHNLFDGMQAL